MGKELGADGGKGGGGGGIDGGRKEVLLGIVGSVLCGSGRPGKCEW